MVLTTTPEYMETLTANDLDEWLQFKEKLLKDKKFLKVTTKEDIASLRKECDILTNEISKRKFKEVFTKIGRCSYKGNEKKN